MVHGLLTSRGLDRYYDLRGADGRAALHVEEDRRDRKWVEPLAKRLRDGTGLVHVDLDIQGLHCTGCVWLMETLFRRAAGGAQIVVNPSLGKLGLTLGQEFDLPSFVADVERFGYLLGPSLKSDAGRKDDGLLARMGLCIAIAMNSMIFAIAIYAGLSDGPLYHLFQRINFVLSFVSMAVGGWVFIRSAWMGLRHRVLHLDLPIALGIVLAFAGSVYSYFVRSADAYFLDTLNVFIALMLVGRFLQRRVLEKNRLALLESDGVDGLLTRRVSGNTVETIRCKDLGTSDVVLLAPGDLVPVEARLRGAMAASFSLDWINGESRPRLFQPGEAVPAGAFHVGSSSVELEATGDFAGSPLVELLRTPRARDREEAGAMVTPWWERFARVYVTAVLAVAALGFVSWFVATRDLGRSLDIATAVLIVTCPCAFGIATPLGQELIQAGLRRAGLFVRAPGFLDRAALVKKVVFDKTGTLTSGTLVLADRAPLEALDEGDRRALYDVVVRSNHPKSIAIRRALEALSPAGYEAASEVSEQAGQGVTLRRAGHEYRLGAAAWAAPGQVATGDVIFARDGALLCDLTTVEDVRKDAPAEIGKLTAEGLEVWLLSGDSQERVTQMAAFCGVSASRAVGAKDAVAKADWLAEKGRNDLLMVGDGINDSLAVERAFCSGTPAIDRPFLPARTDFYFVSAGLRPVRLALRAARAMARVRRRNLAIAVVYNVLAVALAWAGLMSPLACAVLMPVSSLTTILATTFTLSRRAPLWRS